ncbi:hypothetical protein D8674_010631 [Pyrus ussuriensis x Pyrus communis]|uniref:Uncharacterized protein n=1 Tax=Pyrus ussuriensis x Pyrus communis TaxID=2448454 RepID=A0A5N5FGL0_9ROSA|nr:hypothetical protein D8674_010631 [Pyrus ussuriensis x Pyrus communis]
MVRRWWWWCWCGDGETMEVAMGARLIAMEDMVVGDVGVRDCGCRGGDGESVEYVVVLVMEVVVVTVMDHQFNISS